MRVLAATHRDLEAMCKAGLFRRDLLYRINTMTLRIPPLRERTEEIPALVELFLREANAANGFAIQGVELAAMKLLQQHAWPGNVRELRNVIHRAVVLALGARITIEDLPQALSGRTADLLRGDGKPASGAPAIAIACTTTGSARKVATSTERWVQDPDRQRHPRGARSASSRSPTRRSV